MLGETTLTVKNDKYTKTRNNYTITIKMNKDGFKMAKTTDLIILKFETHSKS